MNENVSGFILANKNERVKWKIDGCFFYNIDAIPSELQKKQVSDWMVNMWDGFIEISTENVKMTENEAIRILEEEYNTMSMCTNLEQCQNHKAILVAIDALKEIQSYRKNIEK